MRTAATKKSTWQTPPRLLDAIRETGVRIGFDPATASDNPTDARFFASPLPPLQSGEGWLGRDGLEVAWPSTEPLFLNPPWAKGMPIEPWITRTCDWLSETRARLGRAAPDATLVVPDALNTRWAHALLDQRLRVFAPSARVSYVDPDTGALEMGCPFNTLVFARWPSARRRAFRYPGRWL